MYTIHCRVNIMYSVIAMGITGILPKHKTQAEWVGVVWAEYVTTPNI